MKHSENPPPPPCSAADERAAVAEALSQRGVSETYTRIDTALEQGATIEQLHARIAYFDQHAQDWDGPGALAWGISKAGSGIRVDAGWPKRNRSAIAREQHVADTAEKAERERDRASRKAADEAKNSERESRFGHVLDEMNADAVRELLTTPYQQRHFSEHGLTRPIRLAALRALEIESEATIEEGAHG